MINKENNSKFKELWINENIFQMRKADGVAYLILYVAIPIIITCVTLMNLSNDNISIIYCYITISISAVNSIYDAMNRWKFDKKCVLNTKLFIIMLSNSIIFIYCLIAIFHVLVSKDASKRCDWFLLSYIIGSLVAVIDTFNCFADNMAFTGYL